MHIKSMRRIVGSAPSTSTTERKGTKCVCWSSSPSWRYAPPPPPAPTSTCQHVSYSLPLNMVSISLLFKHSGTSRLCRCFYRLYSLRLQGQLCLCPTPTPHSLQAVLRNRTTNQDGVFTQHFLRMPMPPGVTQVHLRHELLYLVDADENALSFIQNRTLL